MLARTTGRSLVIGVARDGAIDAAFTAPMIADETEKWGEVIRFAGIKAK